MSLSTIIDKEFIDSRLKDIPRDKWLEYIYRMQLKIPVKSVSIGNKEKKIPLENTVGNPLEDPPKICETYMYPEPFPPAKDIIFETIEGDIVALSVGRKPYPSFLLTSISQHYRLNSMFQKKILIQGWIIRFCPLKQIAYPMP